MIEIPAIEDPFLAGICGEFRSRWKRVGWWLGDAEITAGGDRLRLEWARWGLTVDFDRDQRVDVVFYRDRAKGVPREYVRLLDLRVVSRPDRIVECLEATVDGARAFDCGEPMARVAERLVARWGEIRLTVV